MTIGLSSAVEIAAAVKSGRVSALELTQQALSRIETLNPRYNCFTDITASRAIAEANAVDQALQAGQTLPPLAGVPYAVKNLFDIEGYVTLAGAKINASHPPASQDATLVTQMKQAGGILLGALNMDEYAYGFTTENHHYGSTRNPHDPSRSAGGSSGGSAAAVAAGMVPLTLGSDTNGSVRVPSSMCGTFGLKPTYNTLSLEGMFPFVHSFDHAGLFARTSEDLAVTFKLLNLNTHQTLSNIPDTGISGLRIAVAGDYFEQGDAQVNAAIQLVANTLAISRKISLPEVARARAAAYVITASEGGNRHLARLRHQAEDFDPLTRPRLIAGTLIPAAWYIQAQRFRSWFYQQVMRIFDDVDIIIAPATPCCAQKIGQENIMLNDRSVPLRANMGMFTQPISFIGLPVVAAPIQQEGGMPIAIQVIAKPHNEEAALRVASYLEQQGVCSSKIVTN